jgi:ribosomal-protein-alanine N-acetyltransferase
MSVNECPAPIAGASLALRMMRLADVPAVAGIERAAFSEQWPHTVFEREISVNRAARYITLMRVPPAALQSNEGEVVGFAGLWLMFDEAHVVSVAVAPAFQGHGLGRLLVHGLIDVARKHQMSVATLECRESNAVARSLYRAYGFYEVGRRKRYYADNREDAIIMTTEELDCPPYRERFARLESALAVLLPGVHPYTIDA